MSIEKEITCKLSGEMQQNALDFVTFLRNVGMTTHAQHQTAFEYKGKWVCILIINDGGWMLFDNPITKHFNDYTLDEDLRAFALAHVNICTTGHCDSSPGLSKTILGKTFENVCTSEVAFFDPSAEVLNNVKRLIEIWIADTKN